MGAMGRDVLDRILDEFGMRSTHHEDLLDAGERETLKRPVQQRCIADG